MTCVYLAAGGNGTLASPKARSSRSRYNVA
jgi:hypothetical protein